MKITANTEELDPSLLVNNPDRCDPSLVNNADKNDVNSERQTTPIILTKPATIVTSNISDG